jgi:hypothetical protein
MASLLPSRDDSIADWRGSGQGLSALRDFDSRVTSDLVEPAAGPAMSASHPKRPSAMKMRSVAKGHCTKSLRDSEASGLSDSAKDLNDEPR